MKIYKEIVQGSDEWKEIRWGKIGGSSLEKVMANEGKPVENNAIFFEVLAQKCEEFDPFEENRTTLDMIRGNEYEPLAAEEFERVTGKACSVVGWIECDDNFTGISPDRLIGKNEALEIKCPSRNTYAKYLTNKGLILTDYCWQIVQYFNVIENLEVLNFFIYRPENNLKPFILLKITKDTEIQVDKKRTAKVSELVIDAKVRIFELEIALNKKMNELNESNF